VLSLSKVATKIKAYVELVRIHNVVASLLTTIVGWLSVKAYVNVSVDTLLYAVAIVGFISSAGYVINDYFDVEVDMLNKPYRPIPSGRVSPREALALSTLLFVIGVLPSLGLGPYTMFFVLINAFVVFLYSYKVKEMGFVGNVVVSLEGAFTIVLGALAAAEKIGDINLTNLSMLPALYAFTLLLGREVVKTIEDYKADEARKVKSLPRVVGVKKASLISIALQLLVVAISPLPLLLGYGVVYLTFALATDALIIYSVINSLNMLRSSEPEVIAGKVRSYLKVSIFLGILAFLGDSLLKALLF